MSESRSVVAAATPAVGLSARGGMLVPTALFVLYLMHTGAAVIMAVGAFRAFSIVAGFTSAASCAAMAVLVVAGAAGAAVSGAWCRKAPNPMALLFLAESGFGLAALISVGLFRVSRAFYIVLWPVVGHTAAGSFALRLVLAAGMFALPAALYCATIPILARLISVRPQGAGLSLGFSFGLSLAGSALGLAVAGSLVMPSLGIRGCMFMGLAMAGVAAAGSILLRQRGLEGPGALGAALAGSDFSREEPRHEENLATTGRAGVLGAAMALFAFTGWGFLLLWDRALSFIVGRTLQARTTTAAVFLLLLAIGVFLCAALADRLKNPFAVLSFLMAAASVAAGTSMYLMPRVAVLFLELTPYLGRPGLSQLPVVLAAAALMLPAVLFLGAALPLLGQATRILRRPARGIVIFFAMGMVMADLVIGLLAIPELGLRWSISLVSAVGLLAGILFLAFTHFRNPALRPTLGLVFLGLMIVLGAFPASWDPRIIAAGLYRYGARSLQRFGSVDEYLAARQTIEPLFYREGRESSVVVERTLRPDGGMPPVERLTLTVDGKVEATTGDDIRTQVLLGHVPILVHGPTNAVLLIDLLDGVAAGSVLRHPVKSLTVIEREPALFEASATFASYNNSPVEDARLERIVDGARARLLVDPARYDVIILSGLEPWLPQSAALVTSEGLALVKQRLNPGGIAALRLPLAAAGDTSLRTVMRTFARVFPNVFVFQLSGEDLLLLGSIEPLSLDAGWMRNVLSSTGEISRDLRRVTVIGPNEILYAFRLDREGLREVLSDGPLNGDDRSPVEFAAAREMTANRRPELAAAIEKDRVSVLPFLKNYGATPREKSDFLYNLAKSYLGIAGDPLRAKDIARELQASGQTARSRWVMGEALMQQTDLDGAIGEWRGVLEIEPGNLDALFSLGTYFMDSHDYWKADPFLAKAAKQFGDVGVVRYNHGRNLFYLGRNKEAIAELKEARRLGLDQEKRDVYPLVDYLVGVASHRLKNDKEAVQSLENYLKWAYTQPLTRVEVDAHLKLSEAYDNVGRRFDAHTQRQKGEELLLRLRGEESRQAPAGQGAPSDPATGDGAKPTR